MNEYDNEEKRLVNALRSGVFTENVVLDEMNQLKNDRQYANAHIVELQKVKQHMLQLEKAEINCLLPVAIISTQSSGVQTDVTHHCTNYRRKKKKMDGLVREGSFCSRLIKRP